MRKKKLFHRLPSSGGQAQISQIGKSKTLRNARGQGAGHGKALGNWEIV